MVALEIVLGHAPSGQIIVHVAIEIEHAAVDKTQGGDGGHQLRQRRGLIDRLVRGGAENVRQSRVAFFFDQSDVHRRNVQLAHRLGEVGVLHDQTVRRVNIKPMLERLKRLRAQVSA